MCASVYCCVPTDKYILIYYLLFNWFKALINPVQTQLITVCLLCSVLFCVLYLALFSSHDFPNVTSPYTPPSVPLLLGLFCSHILTKNDDDNFVM